MTITWMSRLRAAVAQRSFTLALGALLPIPGALATVLGDGLSKGLSNIGAGFMAHVMGALLLVGGVLTMTGILRGKSLLETSGMVLMLAGAVIYAVGVVFGLGLQGAIAGTGFAAIALGLGLRARTLSKLANVAANE
jgi:hypothetical protein